LDGGRALSAWRRTRMLLLVVARWCRSRRRPGSARCSAEPARATPATGTRRWRAPGRPAASRPAPPPQGAGRPAAATRRPPAHPSARPARPAPPRPPSSLPGPRVHALDAKVSCTQSPGQRPLPLHRDLHRRHHHQRHGNGELPVGPEARPTPGPRCAHTRPTRGRGGHPGPVSGHATSPTAMVVESLHILNPPVVDLVLAPLTHTVC
jgi:hypothetical protein